ncbi:helix-turn-helix domain-containing protein [Alteromonadaceae bacterium BrNp21-10]|nr:helix-turn-helix domain-containing protein [Alteromonadaceae bacterium BrNp21-10]
MPTSQQISRINDVLFTIHKSLNQPLGAKQLAGIAAYSEQHFHRVFQQVVGEPVHAYIRRIRMEFAANQLMFDHQSSVLDIALKSGFSSVSSFSRAFKATFSMSPGQWRNQDSQVQDKPYLIDEEIAQAYERIQHRALPKVNLLELPERHVAYVRHLGYGRSIRSAWQLLQAWANAEQRDFSQQFGLHHSNPACVELAKCRYVACLAIDRPLKNRGLVNSLTIPAGLHGVFKLAGKYGELLPQISHILEEWLPASGFKMQSTPAYVHYHKNHFLAEDERFELDFCLPISLYL